MTLISDLNCCSRSNNQKLAATGDDFGKIKLYSYPVTQPKVQSPGTNIIMADMLEKLQDRF